MVELEVLVKVVDQPVKFKEVHQEVEVGRGVQLVHLMVVAVGVPGAEAVMVNLEVLGEQEPLALELDLEVLDNQLQQELQVFPVPQEVQEVQDNLVVQEQKEVMESLDFPELEQPLGNPVMQVQMVMMEIQELVPIWVNLVHLVNQVYLDLLQNLQYQLKEMKVIQFQFHLVDL
jgi:uncharacterized protein (DUF1499 family)